MTTLPLTHLTKLTHLGRSSWQVECLCGWSGVEEKKRDAISAGEIHWWKSQGFTSVVDPKQDRGRP